MFVKKAKAVIKAMPLLYNALLPCVVIFRQSREVLVKKSRKIFCEIKKITRRNKISRAIRNKKRRAMQKRNLKRFRQYCLYLSKIAPDPLFVKVGANDGITGDPCSDILLSGSKWRGLLIEPLSFCFERLKANFPDTGRYSFEQVAVGSPAREETFYYIDSDVHQSMPDLPVWVDQLGSFDKDHILKHLDGKLAPFIIECQVEVCPLTDVLNRNGIQEVHLLHIDTEGHDFEVLKTFDFTSCIPVAIFVEYRHLGDDDKSRMLDFLKGHGYSVLDCRGDYFALNEKANRQLQQSERGI